MTLRLTLGLGVLATLAACGRSIGDACLISTDCSATGDRSCDLSQPGGYCTVEGCDDHSCPSDSVCVRFFPIDFLTEACQRPTSSAADTSADGGTTSELVCGSADNICVPCKPGVDGDVCADGPDPGLCAPRSTEHRLCVKTCGGNGDCRGGYECRQGKTHGSIPLLSNPGANASFCVPQAS